MLICKIRFGISPLIFVPFRFTREIEKQGSENIRKEGIS